MSRQASKSAAPKSASKPVPVAKPAAVKGSEPQPAAPIEALPPAPANRAVAPAAAPSGATPAALTSVTGSAIPPISLLFDPDWYLTTYPDVAAAGLDPIRHFFEDGAREGRDPNPFFKTEWYLAQNQDVVASKVNPFLHYLLYGAREGRQPAP